MEIYNSIRYVKISKTICSVGSQYVYVYYFIEHSRDNMYAD